MAPASLAAPRRGFLLLLAAAVLVAVDAWRLPTTTSNGRIIAGRQQQPQQQQQQPPAPLGRAGQRTRRYIWPTPEEEEEMEWPRPLEREAEELRKRDPSLAPQREGEEDGEGFPTIMVDGEPQKVRYQPTLSISEDLWPVLSAAWKSIVFLGPEGSSRRSAQMTILSVGAMGLGSLLLFLALLPAGFIHGPTDARTVNSRPTYGTKTYINPDQVLEEDFYRTPGAFLWDDLQDDDDY